MKPWQEQCAEIMLLLEETFPEVQYRITFRKEKNEWSFIVEQVRNDKGPHTGAAFFWLQVKSENVEKLPGLMLAKAKERIHEWQKEGLDKVKKQMDELTKVRDELDKRLAVTVSVEKLELMVKEKDAPQQT